MNIFNEILYPAIHEINETLEQGEKLQKQPNTPLFGNEAVLDSIGLVTLIVTIERIVDERTGKVITLANEKAFSRENSPFKTLGSLAEYIEELLAEGK